MAYIFGVVIEKVKRGNRFPARGLVVRSGKKEMRCENRSAKWKSDVTGCRTVAISGNFYVVFFPFFTVITASLIKSVFLFQIYLSGEYFYSICFFFFFNVNVRNLIGDGLERHFVSYISIDFDAHCIILESCAISRFLVWDNYKDNTCIHVCIMLSQEMGNGEWVPNVISRNELTNNKFYLLEDTFLSN